MRLLFFALGLAACSPDSTTSAEFTTVYPDCVDGVTCDACSEGSEAWYECSDGYDYDPQGVPRVDDPGLMALIEHCYGPA